MKTMEPPNTPRRRLTQRTWWYGLFTTSVVLCFTCVWDGQTANRDGVSSIQYYPVPWRILSGCLCGLFLAYLLDVAYGFVQAVRRGVREAASAPDSGRSRTQPGTAQPQ